MATVEAQGRWRRKAHPVRRQLNVMTRMSVHADLDELAAAHELRGKGEAVAFAVYVAKGLAQYAGHSRPARQLLDLFVKSYRRDRDLVS